VGTGNGCPAVSEHRPSGACMEPGEVWGYRASVRDGLLPVEVLRVGTRRPARVQVRFHGEEAEGRVEWVPPTRHGRRTAEEAA
jgi:hypothetical protein